MLVVRWWVLYVNRRLVVVRSNHADIVDLRWWVWLLLAAAVIQLVIGERGGRVGRRVGCGSCDFIEDVDERGHVVIVVVAGRRALSVGWLREVRLIAHVVVCASERLEVVNVCVV